MVDSQPPNMTDYEAERRSFQLNVPEYFNFATDVIGKWASDPHKPAMLWVGQYGEERGLTFAHFALPMLSLRRALPRAILSW